MQDVLNDSSVAHVPVHIQHQEKQDVITSSWSNFSKTGLITVRHSLKRMKERKKEGKKERKKNIYTVYNHD